MEPRHTHWRLIVFGVLLGLFQGSWACSCFVTHPQTEFCQSQFVVKATVDSHGPAGPGPYPDTWYKLKYVEPFKVPAGYTGGPYVYFYNTDIFSCSLVLTDGVTYVLMGYINTDGLAYLNACYGAHTWDSLTDSQKLGYRSLYSQHCNCQIDPLLFDVIGTAAIQVAPDTCSWDVYGADGWCYSKEAMCWYEDGGCQWMTSPDFDDCLQQ